MLSIKEIPYDDVREILACDELRILNELICKKRRLPMAPESNPTVTLQILMQDVCYTGLGKSEFRNLMAKDKYLIVQLAVALSNKEDLGEEYPPGEELDEEPDRGVILGLSAGAGAGFTTLLHFARDRTKPELMSFLELRRIPHRAKFAKQLREAYQEALAATARNGEG